MPTGQTDGRTDGRQAVTLRSLLWTRPAYKMCTTPAHRSGRGPPWRMNTHFRRCKASERGGWNYRNGHCRSGQWGSGQWGSMYELTTSWPVEQRDFYLPHVHLASPFRATPVEFHKDFFASVNYSHSFTMGIVCAILILAVLVQYRLVSNRRTDRQM